MARRKAAAKRTINPDPLFNSEGVAKFINVVTCNGKKSVAEKIVYGALNDLVQRSRKGKKEAEEGGETGEGGEGGDITTSSGLRKLALALFDKALTAVRPTVEVKSRRIGGATYQVPVEVRKDRGIALAMRWLVEAAQKRPEKTMILRLGGEMWEATIGRGAAIKVRDNVHRMAQANQAFAHFRW